MQGNKDSEGFQLHKLPSQGGCFRVINQEKDPLPFCNGRGIDGGVRRAGTGSWFCSSCPIPTEDEAKLIRDRGN